MPTTVAPISATVATVTMAFVASSSSLLEVADEQGQQGRGEDPAEQQLVEDVGGLVGVRVDAGHLRRAERVGDRRDPPEAGDPGEGGADSDDRARPQQPAGAAGRGGRRWSRGRRLAAAPAPTTTQVEAPPDGEEARRPMPSGSSRRCSRRSTAPRAGVARSTARHRSRSPPGRGGTYPTSGPRPRHAPWCSSGGSSRSSTEPSGKNSFSLASTAAEPDRVPGLVAEGERDLPRSGGEGDGPGVGDLDLCHEVGDHLVDDAEVGVGPGLGDVGRPALGDRREQRPVGHRRPLGHRVG